MNICKEVPKKDIERMKVRLKRHYALKAKIEMFKKTNDFLENQNLKLERDMKELNFSCDPFANMGIDYSAPKVQNEGLKSGNLAEKQLIAGVTKIEKAIAENKKDILKNKIKIYNIEKDINRMQLKIDLLNDEFKKFLELKYEKDKSIEWIAVDQYGGVRATAYARWEDVCQALCKSENMMI